MVKNCRFKAFLLVISLLANVHFVRAQVYIPDSLFVLWMQENGLAGCIDSTHHLDTTCAQLDSFSYIDISYQQVNNLEGIQYFKLLDSLRCNADTTLTNIPALPPQLQVFECRNNQLDSLPPLPITLLRFACEFNQLSALPALPPSLQYLTCYNNLLDSLPPLPSSLWYLYCSGNNLDSLPPLPNSLIILSAYANQLKRLPVLPNTLTELLCSDNLLTALPTLPASLRDLDCYSNNLTALPTLPDSLNSLSCDYNKLTALPALPSTLVTLICEYNNLESLPALPDSLYQLFCDNNPNLMCFPLLNTIWDLEYYNTGITSCVPNYGNVYNSDPPLVSLPLCDSTNDSSGCLMASGIKEFESPVFTIYPNPARDYFVIVHNNFPPSQCVLCDITGKEIGKFILDSSGSTIPVSNLSAGMYFVRISDQQDRMVTRKLVISR